MASNSEGKSMEFTKQMRKATREIHDISDALVNAKLGIGKIFSYTFVCVDLYLTFCLFKAMSDDAVWAEGLKCFYEIFKYLEEALDRLGHTLLGDLDIEGMRRTKAFEQDLEFYCVYTTFYILKLIINAEFYFYFLNRWQKLFGKCISAQSSSDSLC